MASWINEEYPESVGSVTKAKRNKQKKQGTCEETA
jgi:hypothetical protein